MQHVPVVVDIFPLQKIREFFTRIDENQKGQDAHHPPNFKSYFPHMYAYYTIIG
jgi:hypothetical protein